MSFNIQPVRLNEVAPYCHLSQSFDNVDCTNFAAVGDSIALEPYN